jgi:hypothetical protein
MLQIRSVCATLARVANYQWDRGMAANGSVTNRSKVTNGTSLFAWDGDGRTASARRFRDILAQVLDDLGGEERVPEARRQMARRLALLAVEAERQEFDFVVNGKLDLGAFCKASSEARLLAMALGVVEREARLVNAPGPTLEAQAKEFFGADAAA